MRLCKQRIRFKLAWHNVEPLSIHLMGQIFRQISVYSLSLVLLEVLKLGYSGTFAIGREVRVQVSRRSVSSQC